MAITPRHISHVSTLVVAMFCTCASSGCRTLTVPWEHPAGFKKTPVCDAAGPCNQGCAVPPPPVMNADCYGYRFTCWHPWPEHCQPQCDEGCESTPMQIEPTPAESSPSMSPSTSMPPVHNPAVPPVAPATPPETMSEAPPAAHQTSYSPGSVRKTAIRNAAPPNRSNSDENSRGFVQHADAFAPAYSSSVSRDNKTPDYRYLSAVADSPSDGDSSARTTSDLTRAYQEDSSGDRPNKASATSQNTVERFRW